MKKYIIRWDAGYGEGHDVIEADSEEEADQIAYEAWRESAELGADYEAIPYTKKAAEEHGLE